MKATENKESSVPSLSSPGKDLDLFGILEKVLHQFLAERES